MARAKAPTAKQPDAAPAAAVADAHVLADLEARLAEDPDDVDAWLVYADALQKRGDPQGDLITLQIAADNAPAATKSSARAAFKRAFGKRAKTLLGPLVHHGASISDPSAPPFQWRTGFLRTATLTAEKLPVPQALRDLLACPSARLLDTLLLRAETAADLDGVLQALAAQPPRLLSVLHLLARAPATDLTTVWKNAPRLRELSVVAHAIELDGIELVEARRVSLQALAFSAAAMRAVAAAPWPVLERLTLRVGSGADPATLDSLAQATGLHDLVENRIVPATFEDIAPLLRRTDLPKLTHLRICNAPFAGAVLRELVVKPLGRQLEVLDLSKGTLTPRDIEFAASRRSGLGNLRELWVPALTQWAGVADAAASLAKNVITRPPLDVFDRR